MRNSQRLKAFTAVLRQRDLPSFLVTAQNDIRYLTGLDASEALLLVTTRSSTLFVDARYAETAERLRHASLSIADRATFDRAMVRVRRCGYDESVVTAGRVRRWKSKHKNCKFVHTFSFIEGLRRKKDALEISTMKRALAVTNEVIHVVPRMLRPGVTERDVASRILIAMLERGAEGSAFESIVAFGKNTAIPHHRPTDAKLRARDIVQIDIGAKVDGYCADRSEVFFVGQPTALQRSAYDAVAEAKRVAESMLAPGVECAALDRAARAAIEGRGFPPYPHALGHGLGLDIHEGIVISSRSDDAVLPGEALTIEPGVYLEGKFGIRLEDTVFVA